MSFKIVFSDIDGTLLNSQHKLLSSTIEAVRQLYNNGIIFVPVSARMPKAIAPLIDDLRIAAPIISYNGALILSADRNVLFSKKLSGQDCRSILRKIHSLWPQTIVNYYCDDDWYVEDITAAPVKAEISITSAIPLEMSFTDLLTGGILPHKLLCMCPPAVCSQMETVLSAAYEQLTIIRSSPTLLEIIDQSISKAHAVNFFLKLCGISADESIAFGDNYNDLGMLASVGTGIAMGNAPQEIKDAAAKTTASNDDDGIYNALQELGFLSV
ncbi:Cof-type HAD-IIB family hydrolase [Pectinatus haikarae]|uniref:Cof subfamily protein (Haloacid dehalogenase superfamily) n=1 Tax=Pectinatus haikarae TaxID=349096 RepID=A0ABT9Y6M2_9FIRM|nr:Cof-type HAD-IIB family hydrolase [Pectinatus haikarae]MDQ0203175.1 Cof subfamily protein (haloacid dehalogenase superfamily) [Pectinatus haikarae]